VLKLRCFKLVLRTYTLSLALPPYLCVQHIACALSRTLLVRRRQHEWSEWDGCRQDDTVAVADVRRGIEAVCVHTRSTGRSFHDGRREPTAVISACEPITDLDGITTTSKQRLSASLVPYCAWVLPNDCAA
jgi:hypothetical protein